MDILIELGITEQNAARFSTGGADAALTLWEYSPEERIAILEALLNGSPSSDTEVQS
ncbi:hypothetical protein LTV02_17985 [Nocardia yamanashiensis]|uniref:hypothetical protein n=1 Tax=Nocardia yamanashiensis TaxID=209247 RepID=UPI001E2A6ED6|nr:hypothetical protein [Nocardia yamanashiensis]UGT45162.1 hypothetical protein LTV02_17985 [Nocardia yamanashiensis]